MTKRLVSVVVILVAVGIGLGAYYYSRDEAKPQVMTSQVTRGDVTEAVSATGTLEAVTTVQVGTQVSGTIASLNADYNSIVHKGQVVARLDPSLFQTQIDQQRANLVRSEAEVDRLRVQVDDAQTKLTRARSLSERNLIPATDLETAEVNLRAAQAQIQSAQAQVIQSRAALNQAEVNLQHTVIEAPIDGIVISRNVDVGQTVAASMQAPTLFVIAADLTKMQVNANIDEADVGRIRPNQHVVFRVDAYPTSEFDGTVSQIRLQPTTVQNVVTYVTVIDVPNNDLRLKPGMTANVQIQIATRNSVLRVPNTALRFRPTTDIFAALGQTPPPEFNRVGGRPGGSGQGRPANGFGPGTQAQPPAGGGQGQSGATTRPRGTAGEEVPAATDQQPSPQQGQQPGAGQGQGQARPDWQNMSPEERRKRFEERMKNATPEERARMMERMRQFQQRGGPGGPGGAGAPGEPGATPQAGAAAPSPQGTARQATPGSTRGSAPPRGGIANTRADTIDALFGPLPPSESFGRVWRFVDGKLTMVRVRLGVTDGTNTELISGDLPEGTQVVTGVLLQAAPGATQGGGTTGRSPLMGPQRGPGGPPRGR
ncbi:MAG: efflux RND transporter periplasmic adaptor subunit [Acidobacteriota bacterium]